LVSLVTELANPNNPGHIRQQAGLALKNTLSHSHSAKVNLQLAQQWLSIDDEQTKLKIRQAILQTLHAPDKEARKTSAQVLAKIAAVELPHNQWLDVTETLLHNITNPPSEFGFESSLMALGFLCEECKAPQLTSQSNKILTAVIQGMRPTQTNPDVKLAATEALLNSLEFIHANFDSKQERDYIMQVVCEATQFASDKVKTKAFECLVRIASLYYHHLSAYMPAIFNITIAAAKSPQEDVAKQAVEFWSTVAEYESDLLEDENEELCLRFVQSAIKPLVALLLELLTKQDEFAEEGEANISNAAGTCLALVSKCAGDAVVGEVMPFVGSFINSANWKEKEAATLAFCAILDGPSGEAMDKLVSQAIPVMTKYVIDFSGPIARQPKQNEGERLLKDTTVFAVGRIIQYYPDQVLERLEEVMSALSAAIQDEALIASKACWAIHNLGVAIEEIGQNEANGGEEEQTNALSKYMDPVLQALLKTVEREDVGEANLTVNAWEAISALIAAAARDTYEILDNYVNQFLYRLDLTLKSGQIGPRIDEIQGLLCGALQSLTQKLGDRMRRHSDNMMQLLLTLFQNKINIQQQQGADAINYSVQEEALLAVGALANALTFDFERYMQPFAPFLIAGLRNQSEGAVCTIAVSILGDLCSALGDRILPYCDEIITVLLQNLQSNAINRDVKPSIISAFGDVAMAIQVEFEKYLKYVGLVLKQASEAQIDPSNDEMVQYLNLLRESIFESYIGILQGLKKYKPEAFNPYVDGLIEFLKTVASDANTDQEVFRCAVSVIGDLANVYGLKIRQLLSQPWISQLVKDAIDSDEPETKKQGLWAAKQLKRINLTS
jgi:importin subunit beta-1